MSYILRLNLRMIQILILMIVLFILNLRITKHIYIVIIIIINGLLKYIVITIGKYYLKKILMKKLTIS